MSQLQQDRNRETQDAWESFRSHREEVMQLLCEGYPSPGATVSSETPEKAERICLLGAGNCNDLELPQLLDTFSEVHLVDLDGEALRAGVKRQFDSTPAAKNSTRLILHPEFDVTGIAEALSHWRDESPTAISRPSTSDDVEPLFQAIRSTRWPAEWQATFSRAASLCLLSQLFEPFTLALGENHPRWLDLITEVRRQHLRMLIELVRPGGMAVLISDIVSSDTFPPLGQIPSDQLPGVIKDLIQQQNFFTGLNPFVIQSLFQTDHELAAQVSRVRLVKPWLWHLGPRSYAVCALQIHRRAHAEARQLS
jgi:hypothetical protein